MATKGQAAFRHQQTTAQRSVKIHDDAYDQVRIIATKTERPIAVVIRIALREYAARLGLTEGEPNG